MGKTPIGKIKGNKIHSQGPAKSEGNDIFDQVDRYKISEPLQDTNDTPNNLKKRQESIHKENIYLKNKVSEHTKELQLAKNQLKEERLEHQKTLEQLTFFTNNDELTGLPNRSLLVEQVQQGILHAHQQDRLISILFINLDRFTIINETLGYKQGNKLLKKVAKRLFNVAGKDDMVSRTGGDEFVIYLNHHKAKANLDSIATKIVDLFNQPFILKNQEYFITASVGISQYPTDGEDVETLLKHAEMAMKQAENLGKDQYVKCSRALKSEVLETTLLTNDLYQAIERNEMQLYYQPKVNGLTGEILGVEALLRWRHPELGFVSPAKFIPLAEETRLILPIGQWVLETASKQWRKWQNEGFRPITLAVNFSIHQLNYPNIVEQIEEIVERTSIDINYLEIEITESLAMDNNQKIKDTLKRIKDLGISLALDDFGKAYSSLNRLKASSMHRIKIDMSFIQGIGISAEDETIVKAALSLASNLRIEAVAEGVETKEQVEFLNKTTCNQLQGYYFYKPMSAVELKKLLVADQSDNPANN